jgi:hypothetical protein
MRRSGLRACRRAVVTRFFAIVLVILAALPFTAPFSTFDQPVSGPAHGEFVSASKLVQDEAPITALTANHVQPPAGILICLSSSGRPVDVARSGPLVLRL